MNLKRLYWIGALLLLFFVGDRAAGWILAQLNESSQFRYTRMYTDQAKSDILLLGNSRGLIFYQPYIEEKTGRSTFNLSYNGLPIDLGYTLVADYLDHYPAPELLLIDISMCDRINRELVSGFNLYAPHSDNISQLIKSYAPEIYYGGQLSHLFLYNSEVFQRSLYYLNKSDEDWLLDRVINDNLVQSVEDAPQLDFNYEDNYLIDELAKTVKLAQSKGVKVKLVVNPYYPPFAQRIKNFSSWMERVEKQTGLSVGDYTQAVTDRQGFGDYQHLNKYGAKLYIDQLVEDGVF
ncbi:MAG: hypothetical protein AAGG75_26195 [Bacteroidota bacterium]